MTSEQKACLHAAAPDLLRTCKKVAAWLTKLAEQAEQQTQSNARFPSLAEACQKDAANYRKTAADIQVSIDKAEGKL